MDSRDTSAGSVEMGAGTPGGPLPGSPTGPSLLQRTVWLATAPSKVFTPPRGMTLWLVPLIVLSLVQLTQSLLLKDLYMAQVRTTIEQNDRIPEEQKEMILANMEKGPSLPGGQILQQGFGLAGAWLLVYLLPAALYLLGLNFVLGARARFWEVFSVVAFTALVTVPRELLRVPIMLSRGSIHVYTSPAAFAGTDSGVLLHVLNLFDVFDLYRLFLLAAGFATITALPIKRTAFPVVVVWALYALVGIGCRLSPLGQYMP